MRWVNALLILTILLLAGALATDLGGRRGPATFEPVTPARVLPSPVPPVATATPAAAPAPDATQDCRVGQRCPGGRVAVTVLGVSRHATLGHWRPEAGHVYVNLAVLVEAVGGPASYNPWYFGLKDGDGYEYDIAIPAVEPALQYGQLRAGERVRGNLAFEVPQTAKGLMVLYELLDGEPLRIRLE